MKKEKIDDDLAKLLKYELGDTPSVEDKAECLAQRFYSGDDSDDGFTVEDRSVQNRRIEREGIISPDDPRLPD
jgi:hypothetical protein